MPQNKTETVLNHSQNHCRKNFKRNCTMQSAVSCKTLGKFSVLLTFLL